MNTLFAHVKWFVQEHPDSLANNLSPLEIAIVLLIVVLGVLMLFGLQLMLEEREWSRRISDVFAPLRPYLPDVVRIVTGVLLILNGISQYFYAPNLAPETLPQQVVLTSLMVIGALFIVGLYTRLAAITLLVLYAVSYLLITPISLLEHFEYIGLALFILFMGCGPYAIDNKLEFSPLSWCKRYEKWAYPALRITAGVGLIVLALTEKLLNIDLASTFLLQHQWNIFESLGVTNRMFIMFSGSAELLIGLSFILNFAARITSVLLLGLFITTAVLLGPLEIVGHLFAIPVVVAILIYGKRSTSKSENA